MVDSKTAKLRVTSKIGKLCRTVPPTPALPLSPPRSAMNSSVELTEDIDSFAIGDKVWVGGTKRGCIAYIGETQFAPGDWAGVVLDEPIGKNDGTVAGLRYFQCEPKRGIFSRLTRLTREPLSARTVMSSTCESGTTSPSYGSRTNLNNSLSPSPNSSTTSVSPVSRKDLKIGTRVIISSTQGSKSGVLRFIGTTKFASGEWCGIELDNPVGKNDGAVGNVRYFECHPRYGLFVLSHKVRSAPLRGRSSPSWTVNKRGSTSMSSLRKSSSSSSIASPNARISTQALTSDSKEGGIANAMRTSLNSLDESGNCNKILQGKKELDTLWDWPLHPQNSAMFVTSEMACSLDDLNETPEHPSEDWEKLEESMEVGLETTSSSENPQSNTKRQQLAKTVKKQESDGLGSKSRSNRITQLSEIVQKEEDTEFIDKYASERKCHETENRLESVCAEFGKEITLLHEDWKNWPSDDLPPRYFETENSIEAFKKNVESVIEDNKILETSAIEWHFCLKKLEAKVIALKRERDEAVAIAQLLSAKYDEMLEEVKLTNSSWLEAVTGRLEGSDFMTDRFIRADVDETYLVNRLKKSELLVEELTEKLRAFANTLQSTGTKNSNMPTMLSDAQYCLRKLEELLSNSEKVFNIMFRERNEVSRELQERDNQPQWLSGATSLVPSERTKLVRDIIVKAKSLELQGEEIAISGERKLSQLEDLVPGRSDVRRKTIAAKEDQIVQGIIVESMKKEIDNLREMQIDVLMDDDGESVPQENDRPEIEGLHTENEYLGISEISTELSSKTERKNNVSSDFLQELDIPDTKCLRSFEEALDPELARLQESQHELNNEHNLILKEFNDPPEGSMVLHKHENNNHELIDKKNLSTGGILQGEEYNAARNPNYENHLKNLADENETYKMHIEFLNSVIVDMQRKNEALACKIEVLEIGVPMNEAGDYSRNTLNKRMSAPRMFCDICDRFDLHETEHCPRQDQEFEEPRKPGGSRKKPLIDRPYCDMCEKFGHSTVNCDDPETF